MGEWHPAVTEFPLYDVTTADSLTGHRGRFQGGAALLSLAALVLGSPVDQVLFQHSKGGKGAVASESRVCSQIGIDLLERGVSTSFISASM